MVARGNISFQEEAEKIDKRFSFELVPIEDIQAAWQLNREISEKKVKKVTEKLLQTGRMKPIILDTYGDKPSLVDGHHRYVAMKRLGYDVIPAYVFNGDMTDLTPTERRSMKMRYQSSRKWYGVTT